MLVYHAGCLAAASAVRTDIGTRPDVRNLGSWTVVSALAVLGAFIGLHRMGWLVSARSPAWQGWGIRSPLDTALALYYVAVNPILEERFWRASLLGPEVRRRIGKTLARGLASFGFVPFHAVVLAASYGWSRAVLLSVPILFASWVWVVLYERRRQAWTGIAIHLGVDLGLVLGYFMWLRHG